jgi:hypothetical protein
LYGPVVTGSPPKSPFSAKPAGWNMAEKKLVMVLTMLGLGSSETNATVVPSTLRTSARRPYPTRMSIAV